MKLSRKERNALERALGTPICLFKENGKMHSVFKIGNHYKCTCKDWVTKGGSFHIVATRGLHEVLDIHGCKHIMKALFLEGYIIQYRMRDHSYR